MISQPPNAPVDHAASLRAVQTSSRFVDNGCNKLILGAEPVAAEQNIFDLTPARLVLFTSARPLAKRLPQPRRMDKIGVAINASHAALGQ